MQEPTNFYLKKVLLVYITNTEHSLCNSNVTKLVNAFISNPTNGSVKRVLIAYFTEHRLFEEHEIKLVDAFVKEPTNVDVRKVLLTYIERRSLYHKSAAKLLNAVSQPSKASPKPPKAILLLY